MDRIAGPSVKVMDEMRDSILKINEGYKRIQELRKEFGVKPGESLLKAMGANPPWVR